MYPTAFDLPLTGLNWLEYYSAHNVYHPGIDFNKGYGNSDCGQVVKAPKSGFVIYRHDNVSTSGGFGKFIIIQHNDGNYTRYAHLQDINDKVVVGKEVKASQIIGHLGNTGTTYCHLHFEVFNEDCATLQRKHWRPWRMYPSSWSKAKVQEYYLNPWEWLDKKQETTLYLFEMIAKLKSAGLMSDDVGIDSKVSVKDMRTYLDYFLTNL